VNGTTLEQYMLGGDGIRFTASQQVRGDDVTLFIAIEGVVYPPRGHTDITGNSTKDIGGIVSWTLEVSGTVTVTGEGLPWKGQPELTYLVR
jgi:hypothetical protein